MSNGMYKKISTVILFSAVFINGCGSDSEFTGVGNLNTGSDSGLGSGSGSNPDFIGVANLNTSTSNTFDGRWSNGCTYDPFLSESNSISLIIAGAKATLSVNTYAFDSCAGTPTATQSTSYKLTYPGQIALSDCYNAQKINTKIEYPITINGVSFTQEQYEALSTQELKSIDVFAKYDLFCTNQTGTVLYNGEMTSGLGNSDASRPTRADLTIGLTKVQ